MVEVWHELIESKVVKTVKDNLLTFTNNIDFKPTNDAN